MIVRPLIVALCASLTLPAAAMAQTGAAATAQTQAEAGWSVEAGPGVMVRPEYQGAESYDIMPIPIVSVTYSDWFFLDPARGLGVQKTILPGVLVGGGANYFFGREEDDSARLTGMGDLDGGASAVGFASLRPFTSGIWQALSLDTRVEAPFTGDIGGAEITADLVATAPFGGGLIAVSAGAGWMTEEMMDDLFGVSPAQSATSMFPAYDPDGGLRAWRFGVTALRPLDDRWTVFATAGYERLTEDAGRSPLVETKDQFRLATALVYSFD